MILWIICFVVAMSVAVWWFIRAPYDRVPDAILGFLVGGFLSVFACLIFQAIFFDQLAYQKYEVFQITSPVTAGLVNGDYSYQITTDNNVSVTLVTQDRVTGVDTTQPAMLTESTTCVNSLWAWGGCSDKHYYHISTGPQGVLNR